jgi:hypothetical protein
MKQATTLQFRSAVRQVARDVGIDIYASWTNQSTPGTRTVGFAVSVATFGFAVAVEKILGAQGLTANTHATRGRRNVGYRTTGGYIRGKCAF